MNGQFAARMAMTLTRGTGIKSYAIVDHGEYTIVCGNRAITLDQNMSEREALAAVKQLVKAIYS